MKKEALFVALSAVLYGMITIGGRLLSNAGFSLYETALFPVATVATLLGLVALVRPALAPRRRELPFFLVYGLIGALLQITQYGGIALGVPVAVVAMLLYTQPIWTTLMSRLWLGEPLTRPKLLAMLLAVAGVVVLLDPTRLGQNYPLAGLLSTLAAGIALAFWVIWSKRADLYGHRPPFTRIFGYSSASALWLLAFYPIFLWLVPSPAFSRLSLDTVGAHWTLLLGVALSAYILPNAVFFLGIGGVEASIAGTLLMLEPVSAALLAVPLFGEPITWNILAGGLLILLADYLVMRFNR